MYGCDFWGIDMSVAEFIEQLEAAVEVFPEGTLKPETRFHTLEDWSSICALMTLAMVFAEYQVQLSGAELDGCDTVEALYNQVMVKASPVGV
jgi:acyl carrier protein